MGDNVDINTLTMEQYLGLIKDNIRSGIVKLEISNDIEFEINGNFMRELRRKLFKGTDKEDAHKHVRRVLEIPDLFHFPSVTHDVGNESRQKRKMGKKDMKEPVPRDFPKIHKKKAREDEVDMDDGWDIMIKDVERIRQILTPSIHTLPNLELVVQPYMPRGPIHNKVKVVREEEMEYDIPLQNYVMQPLTL
nr:hypothetical protein [Tanacetum cinerariifolium]